MATTHSVTELIDDLKCGDPIAAQKIWDRYVKSLIRIANNRLRTARLRLGDEEDAVVMAFTQFLERVGTCGFSKLNDRLDLWRILVVLTERRAFDMIRREASLKSGGNSLVGESHLGRVGYHDELHGLDRIAGADPTPEFAIALVEEFDNRLNELEKDELKSIAIAKMNGFNNREISQQSGISLRSVERKLKLIRTIWDVEIKNESQ